MKLELVIIFQILIAFKGGFCQLKFYSISQNGKCSGLVNVNSGFDLVTENATWCQENYF